MSTFGRLEKVSLARQMFIMAWKYELWYANIWFMEFGNFGTVSKDIQRVLWTKMPLGLKMSKISKGVLDKSKISNEQNMSSSKQYCRFRWLETSLCLEPFQILNGKKVITFRNWVDQTLIK